MTSGHGTTIIQIFTPYQCMVNT